MVKDWTYPNSPAVYVDYILTSTVVPVEVRRYVSLLASDPASRSQ